MSGPGLVSDLEEGFMKYAIAFLTVVFFAVCVVIGQQSATSSRADDLREIERLESEWNAINEISDAEGKARLLAEDSYHVGPSGRLYNKAQDVEAMISSRQQKQSTNRSVKFLMSNQRIRMYKDIAVVTATGTSVTTRDGQERRGGAFRVIHVWEKRHGTWLLVVDQVTAVAR
jgi:uncharacterized protein (TIGR02246 family)